MKYNKNEISSIHKIAKLANVSAATVSRVLNNKDKVRSSTRIRIQDVMKKYNE